MKETYVKGEGKTSGEEQPAFDVENMSQGDVFFNRVVDAGSIVDVESSLNLEAEDLSDDAWGEAIVAAMKQTAARGFIAPEHHLSSLRELIKQATAGDV